mgnify:CR=1 FL=1
MEAQSKLKPSNALEAGRGATGAGFCRDRGIVSGR